MEDRVINKDRDKFLYIYILFILTLYNETYNTRELLTRLNNYDFPSIIDHCSYKLYLYITLFLNFKHLNKHEIRS